MSLKVYWDTLSQPCRAVMILLEKEKVPYDPVIISLVKREQKTHEEFGRVCPVRKVPAIDDKGFTLFESSAILKYLVGEYKLPGHWYPEDPKKRARIDQCLAWQAGSLRNGLFFHLAVAPTFNIPKDEAKLTELKSQLKTSLELFQSYFLSEEGPFMFGSEITIADIQCLCELTQFWMCGVAVEESFPRVKTWMKACQDYLGEAFKKAHATVYEMAESGKFTQELKFD